MRHYPDEQMRADMHACDHTEPQVTSQERCIVALVYTGCTCTVLYVSFSLIGTYHEALGAALPPLVGLNLAVGWRRRRMEVDKE